MASKLSAEAAVSWLRSIGYPEKWLSGIAHAIEAHSFSANVKPQTIEACCVQDADRLDGIGAIGSHVFLSSPDFAATALLNRRSVLLCARAG